MTSTKDNTSKPDGFIGVAKTQDGGQIPLAPIFLPEPKDKDENPTEE